MLRRTIAALVLCLFYCGNAVAEGFSLVEIAPGVFAHQGQTALMTAENIGDIANIGAIVGDDAVAVVDTGGSLILGREFLVALRQKTDKPIRFVINTHEHPDHVFGNGAFISTGAIFVGHESLTRSLATRGPHYLSSFREAMSAALDGVTLVPPTKTVASGDRLRLDLGGRELILQAWGAAHSDCDLTVLDSRSGVLFAGDLLFLKHVPIIDASLLGFLKIADELAAIPARLVVPGHGPLTAPWPQALDDERTYLMRLAGDLRAAIKSGAQIDDAVKTAGESERGRWALFDDYHKRNATAGFAELEWETP